jgi:hypothetical protein
MERVSKQESQRAREIERGSMPAIERGNKGGTGRLSEGGIEGARGGAREGRIEGAIEWGGEEAREIEREREGGIESL